MYVEEKKSGETTVSELGQMLLNAAEFLESHGWCQDSYRRADNYCFVGAIYAANISDFDRPNKAHSWANAQLSYKGFFRQCTYADCPTCWNDAIAKDKAEVISKLREVAYKV